MAPSRTSVRAPVTFARSTEGRDGGRASSEQFGPYRLETLLGRGGMAEVFRARDPQGREVAVKRLLPRYRDDPSYVGLFAREAALGMSLRHPHVVRIFASGRIGSEPFIAMELIEGRDLAAILRRCRERGILLPVDFAAYLGTCLFEALACAHGARGAGGRSEPVVHGDVSPSNIFISRLGEVKLGDFGLARICGARTRNPEGGVWGKVFYLAPEALETGSSLSADLWAAWVVLYEMLANTRPFAGADPLEVTTRIRAGAPRRLRLLRPEIGADLEALVHCGLAADPAARPGSAADLAAVLRPLYDERVGTPLAIAAVVRGLFESAPAVPLR